MEVLSFHEARENWKSLREIKEKTRESAANLKKEISDTIIMSLNTTWFKVNKWDTLAHIAALTAVWNKLSFYPEADNIEIWDIITIKWGQLMRNNDVVWKVISGFQSSEKTKANTRERVASVRGEIEQTNSTQIRVNSIQQISLRDQEDSNLMTPIIDSLPHQISNPIERSGSWTTLCSKTARLNLAKFGIRAPRWASAFKSMNMYPRQKLSTINNIPHNANVADIFSYALNRENSQYGDRAAAYKASWEWFVLDPYTRFPSRKWWTYEERRKPIPLEEYKQVRNIKSVVYYNVNTNSNENLAMV